MKKSDLPNVGYWCFFLGVIASILAGFTEWDLLPAVLMGCGVLVGLLMVEEEKSTSFLVAVIALLTIGMGSVQIFVDIFPRMAKILSGFVSFVSAAGFIVALKEVINLARKKVE